MEEIYEVSQYGENDLYRIPDICHSLDSKQWTSKRWLVDELKRITDERKTAGRINIAGGWYGLLASLLYEEYRRDKFYITTGDIDPMAEYYGRKLFPYPPYDFGFETEDSFAEFPDCCIWITTSGEHIEADVLSNFLKQKPENTIAVIQSNDFFEHATHINCYVSIEQFKESLPLKEILYEGTLDLGDFKRFMVIGV